MSHLGKSGDKHKLHGKAIRFFFIRGNEIRLRTSISESINEGKGGRNREGMIKSIALTASFVSNMASVFLRLENDGPKSFSVDLMFLYKVEYTCFICVYS